jgi:hypothetical protein
MILGTFNEVKNPHPPQWVLWKGAMAIGRGTAAALAIVSRATPPPRGRCQEKKIRKRNRISRAVPHLCKGKEKKKSKRN